MKLILKEQFYTNPIGVNWQLEGVYVETTGVTIARKNKCITIDFSMFDKDGGELYTSNLKFDDTTNVTPTIEVDGTQYHLLAYLAENPLPENPNITSFGYADVDDVSSYFIGGTTALDSIEINPNLPASYQFVIQQVVLRNLFINGELAVNQFIYE